MTEPVRTTSGGKPGRPGWIVPLSVAVILVYIVFIEWLIGWAALWAAWAEIGPWRVAGAFALMLISYAIRCLRIQDYFAPDLRGLYLPLFRVTQVHNLINIILPFRSGEASFPLLMRSQFAIPLARSTSALLWMRALDLHALLAVGGLGLVGLSARPGLSAALWLAFCLLPLGALVAQKPATRMALAYAPLRWKPLLTSAVSGLPTDARAFARAWFMTVLNWGIKVATIAWVLSLLGVAPWMSAIGGALGGELSSVLPAHAPAGVGTYPAGITAGAAAFGGAIGAPELQALAKASVNAHLLMLASALIGTSLGLLVARPRLSSAA